MLTQRQEGIMGNSWLGRKSLEGSKHENMDDCTESLQIPLKITFAIGSIAKLFVISSDHTG